MPVLSPSEVEEQYLEMMGLYDKARNQFIKWRRIMYVVTGANLVSCIGLTIAALSC